MRLVEFHRYLDDDNSLRAEFELERGKVLKFMVQLECKFAESDEFKAVIRYDTAHGFAHLDRLHPYQQAEKSTMATQDYNEALTFAIGDLVKNWSGYRRRYEEWARRK